MTHFHAIYDENGNHCAKSNLIFQNDAAEVYYFKLSSGIRNFKFLPKMKSIFSCKIVPFLLFLISQPPVFTQSTRFTQTLALIIIYYNSQIFSTYFK